MSYFPGAFLDVAVTAAVLVAVALRAGTVRRAVRVLAGRCAEGPASFHVDTLPSIALLCALCL